MTDRHLVPRILYRFRPNNTLHSFEEELSHAVLNQKVWITPLNVQNDPFEANPYFEESSDVEIANYAKEIREYFGADISFSGTSLLETAAISGINLTPKQAKVFLDIGWFVRAFNTSYVNSFEHLRKITKVACFVEDGHSILMWSHYANSHQGICLEYEIPKSVERTKVILGLVGITYSLDRPKVTSLEVAKYMGATGRIGNKYLSVDDAKDILQRTNLTKSNHWKYEKEWRWVQIDETDPSYISVAPMTVKSITIGANATTETTDLALKIAKQRCGVSVFQAELSRNKYEIERRQIY